MILRYVSIGYEYVSYTGILIFFKVFPYIWMMILHLCVHICVKHRHKELVTQDSIYKLTKASTFFSTYNNPYPIHFDFHNNKYAFISIKAIKPRVKEIIIFQGHNVVIAVSTIEKKAERPKRTVKTRPCSLNTLRIINALGQAFLNNNMHCPITP
ncbi:hypothetical protein V6Z12_A01G099200 [Gossypium hirsutum]